MKWLRSLGSLELLRGSRTTVEEPDKVVENGYNADIDMIREREYPMLKDVTYLDHAGATIYAKSLMDRFSQDMVSHLYGNPHSGSPSSLLSTRRVDDARLRVLQFFRADPEFFDVVFVANATAGIKLVMDAFRGHCSGGHGAEKEKEFWFGYHRDSHTSLVGIRETAVKGHHCFISDDEVDAWLDSRESVEHMRPEDLGLFAYPAQSNMNGRRLPLDWVRRLRQSSRTSHQRVFSLLDVAALVSTSPLDLSDPSTAPDFAVLSFYKIFGFPDLGALIVRKEAGHVLDRRAYYGGGTVDMVTCFDEPWHVKKSQSLHDGLEDGTLPFHSIIALDAAMSVHQELYGSMERISRHTSYLSKQLYQGLVDLCHTNGRKICKIYKDPASSYGDSRSQGASVAFNIQDRNGRWVGKSSVEKLATAKNIHIRTGGLCNPGGIASALDLTTTEMKENFAAGQRCGDDHDIMGGKPTGVIRVSLGAMSNMHDVEVFIGFIREFYTDSGLQSDLSLRTSRLLGRTLSRSKFFVESLTVYPIKSCSGWDIPADTSWEVHQEGLAWDREWCLVHLGTATALSQKRYPKMALLHPRIDIDRQLLHIRHAGDACELTVPMSLTATKAQCARICGDTLISQTYTSPEISNFFSNAIGVPCTLARFSPATSSGSSTRHTKFHLQQPQSSPVSTTPTPIHFSNESPILVVSRSSLNQLNREIRSARSTDGKAAQAECFRANIVIAQTDDSDESSYIEDSWRGLQIGNHAYDTLGPCRRCNMICIDPTTGQKNEEPLVTLAKTRRGEGGKVFFGVHCCCAHDTASGDGARTIRVGDVVDGWV